MAMKMLLSTVFEQALEMSQLESTFYSAFCLCFYWACRTLSPLLSSTGDRVFGLYFWVLLLECAAYALTPLAIKSGKSWVFTVFRILSGGGFATLNANVTPLIAKMFGLRDLHVVIAVCSWFEPLAGFGAVVAWVMHIDHDAAGGRTEESYNLFLCALEPSLLHAIVYSFYENQALNLGEVRADLSVSVF
jgi:MFS family permease